MPEAGRPASKSQAGRCFEDFRLGEHIRHAPPRTLTTGDASLYLGLTGSRFPLHCSTAFARSLGLPQAPLDDLLVFHVVLGKTVPDISVNAIANLGYAAGRFGAFVYPGDTLMVESTVIGLKENANRRSGIVYIRSSGTNQRGEPLLDYIRWVMVRKRDPAAAAPAPSVPDLPSAVELAAIEAPKGLTLDHYDCDLAGAPWLWDDFAPGERIDHLDGMTLEESCHMMATRLYQNTARVHFDQHAQSVSRFGRRLVYGGHIISLARALSFNGLGNALRIAAIHGGRHAAPSFAGDTIYAWSEVLEKQVLPGHSDLGALRLRTIATKDRPCADFPYRTGNGDLDPAVVLEFDYTVFVPRRIAG